MKETLMALSKEEWAGVEKTLSGFGSVRLTCDGYRVDATVEKVSAMKLGIVVYVNGLWKGAWMRGEAEEAKKFFRPVKRFLHTPKQREELLKLSRMRGMPVQDRKHFADRAVATTTIWHPDWTNAKAFCRNLRKTCQSIELCQGEA
jgi:hypothetical protein